MASLRTSEFGPPEAPSLASLTDGRKVADFRSAYPALIWVQIILELGYLLLILIASVFLLSYLALVFVHRGSGYDLPAFLGTYPSNRKVLLAFVVALSGACGGTASSLKWLYHTVAKQRWHRDRIVWRLVVPILSAILATFTTFMVNSALIPFNASKPLISLTVCAGFGFFVGMFFRQFIGQSSETRVSSIWDG